MIWGQPIPIRIFSSGGECEEDLANPPCNHFQILKSPPLEN